MQSTSAYFVSALVHAAALAWLHVALEPRAYEPLLQVDPGRAMVELTASAPPATADEVEFVAKPEPVPPPPLLEPALKEPVERQPPRIDPPVQVDVPLPMPDIPLEVAQHEPPPPPERTQPDSKAQQVARQARREPLPEAKAAVPTVFSPSQAGSQVDQLPKNLPTNRPPAYPSDAVLLGQEGRVVVRVRVSAAGTAAWVRLETSSGFTLLDQAALAAVQTWRFTPARRGGQPVEFEVLAPIPFSIRR